MPGGLEPPYSVSGRSVPSIDPADLGFAEIDVPDIDVRIRISLVCHVDLSIAVSGSQGTPAQVAGSRLVAARGITIRTRAAPVGGNREVHNSYTFWVSRLLASRRYAWLFSLFNGWDCRVLKV